MTEVSKKKRERDELLLWGGALLLWLMLSRKAGSSGAASTTAATGGAGGGSSGSSGAASSAAGSGGGAGGGAGGAGGGTAAATAASSGAGSQSGQPYFYSWAWSQGQEIERSLSDDTATILQEQLGPMQKNFGMTDLSWKPVTSGEIAGQGAESGQSYKQFGLYSAQLGWQPGIIVAYTHQCAPGYSARSVNGVVACYPD